MDTGFTSKIFLPILKKNIRIKPITNRYYFDLIKYITNNDEEGISTYFDFILNEIIIDNSIIKNLSNIDKFYILLNAKALSSGNKLQLIGKNEIKTEIKVSDITNTISIKLKDIDLTKIILYDQMEITLSIPTNLYIDNIDQIYKEIIFSIKIGDDILNFFELTELEKDSILTQLPVSMTGDILNYINSTQKKFININLINKNEKLGLDDLNLNAFDNTLFYFIKSLFNDNLRNFYELQFILINKINMAYDHFLSITPNDCKVFINLYNEDIKRQQEDQKSNSPSMPSMPTMPKFK